MTSARPGVTSAEVVVVGGGILGAATAHQLAGRGHRVVVLERGAVNREGSGTTAGNLHMQAIHARRPGQAIPVDVARFLPLQLAAARWWASIEDELGTSVELRRNGGFMVAETEQQLEELRHKRELEAAAGVESEIVSGDEARRVIPLLSPAVLAADFCPADGYANPLLVTPAFLAAAVRAGAEVHPFSAVTAVTRQGTGWLVETPRQSFAAPFVVNVAGPWIAEVAAMSGLTVEMAPLAIQMLLTVRVEPVLGHLVQHIGEGLSVKQVTAGHILVGGGWPALSLDLAGRSKPSVASILGNVEQAGRILPFLRNLRLLRAWAGPLAATRDEMPVIGSPPGEPTYLVCGGTYSFTLAPLWARCLTALIEGSSPPVSLDGLGLDRLLGGRRLEGTAS
jgi:sarcosine oxidase subunit beta